MNFLNQYYTAAGDNQIAVSAAQGSDFAKIIAGDFNPIHNPDSKRFCVPGDLLFAIALSQYGLHEHMAFEFLDLVKADTLLRYPRQPVDLVAAKLQVVSDKNKPVLGIEYSGLCAYEPLKIEQVLKNYVAFSGQNFPHILVPLMKQYDVMINPNRPLVIYESMSFQFDRLEFDTLEIVLEQTTLVVNGKRGDASLHFSLKCDQEVIGSGLKNLVLSGLRKLDELAIDQMCEEYLASKLGS